MSLMRNITKAKQALDKQKGSGKLSGAVGKATSAVDKATKGKSAKLTAKVDAAAKKFDQQGITHSDAPQ
ncbi:MAG TPA: hypothetical protein VNQ73_00610 [Ilumatobacter sp.]|nr:hypothetical protein [Ilumatobacter sp.]